MITPDGSATGVVADEPQSSNRGIGRRLCQKPNRADQHLAATHEEWANQMIGDALYQHALTIM